MVKFSGQNPEARFKWGHAPYYLARVHKIIRGTEYDERNVSNARRTMKEPADLNDFAEERASDDEKVYSLQWFVSLDALVAMCPTAIAWLAEAKYPLPKVKDVRNKDQRVEEALWRPSTNLNGESHDNDESYGRLFSQSEFKEVYLKVTELCHFYDDKDLDENVGVSSHSKCFWRFVFDPKKGFTPDPKKLRQVCTKMGSKYGTCKFNNFHVTDQGYVLCDECDRPHHLTCVEIDPASVPPPPDEQGFRPNRSSNEIGTVRGVRAQRRPGDDELKKTKTKDKDDVIEIDGAEKGFFNTNGVGLTEPWFCGEACRRNYFTKQSKLVQEQIVARRLKEQKEENDNVVNLVKDEYIAR